MTVSSRFAAGALLGLALLVFPALGAAAGPAGPLVSLHWDDPIDTSTVRTVAPGDTVDLYVTMAGVDTLMGYQVEVRIVRGEGSQAWRFVAKDGCSAAALIAAAEGTRAIPAPWRSKLFLSDAREMQNGQSRLVGVAAFHPEPLDTTANYTLCRFRLVPPEGEGCAGWDSGARFEITRLEYLLARRQQRTSEAFGKPLVLELKAD